MPEPDNDPHGIRAISRQADRHDAALTKASPEVPLFEAHNVKPVAGDNAPHV